MFSDIMHGIMITMSPDCLLALCIGAMFGTVVGALPGLGTAVAITICIPFTLQMGNASAIALLLGVYATSIYGGSISAVLLNTPGTPQSACTGFEGYAMAKAGKAEKALGWVTVSSVLGGLFSCVALVIAAPQLADLSVKYGGPLEICGLICLGLACITSLSEDNQIKGLLMGVAGLFLATIGVDPLSGEMRFTFGSPQLVSGIDLMPIVVGVFPLAELFYRAYEVHANVEPTAIDCKRISFPTWQEWKGRGLILLRSSLIGVGSVPYFAMMDLFKKAGAQVRHVPFSGDADAFQAIAGNRVQVYTSTAGSLDQYDVKGLALMDATRDPLLPNLPTVRESGVEAYYSQWMPLLAPKGLPADVKATLSDAMRKAMQSPEFVERLHKLNLVPGYLDSKDCRAFVEEESVRNAEVIKGLMAK